MIPIKGGTSMDKDSLLATGVGNSRNVSRYCFGRGSITKLSEILDRHRSLSKDWVVFLIDEYFDRCPKPLGVLPVESTDRVIHIRTNAEPSTQFIDSLVCEISASHKVLPSAVIGIGGGITMDVAKAISNLLTNGGRAEEYQGWDLVKEPGIYKIGIPTISGTGAEATRTCVMTNEKTGIKLGMNSDHTVFDQLILDPQLTATVPRNQYFFTGMDAWIHCIEALSGSYRNPVGDAFSTQTITLCREVFSDTEMMSEENREKLMVASYLGGCAIATTYVGVVHPFSAGLSVVLGLHHCVANCITMMAMESYYPDEHREFMEFVEQQDVCIPKGVCSQLSDLQFDALYQATIVHEKPLTNALGDRYRDVLDRSQVRKIFEKM
jgi:3-deoxy-alpha-D-manno-octulosonate 8-oxidase